LSHLADQRIRCNSFAAVSDWPFRTYFLLCEPTHARDRGSSRVGRTAGQRLENGAQRRSAAAHGRLAPGIDWSIFGNTHHPIVTLFHEHHRHSELRWDIPYPDRGRPDGVLYSGAPRFESGADGGIAVRVIAKLILKPC